MTPADDKLLAACAEAVAADWLRIGSGFDVSDAEGIARMVAVMRTILAPLAEKAERCDEAVALLRELDAKMFRRCLVCGNDTSGHYADCRLAAALLAARQGGAHTEET